MHFVRKAFGRPNCKHRESVPNRKPGEEQPDKLAPMTWMQHLKRVFAIDIEVMRWPAWRCATRAASRRFWPDLEKGLICHPANVLP